MEKVTKQAKYSMSHYYNMRERRLEEDPRYMEGKIYMIQIDEDLYVGSTITTLESRLAHHMEEKNKDCPDSKLYALIEKIGGWEGVDLQLLENRPCKNKFILQVQETKWMKMLNSTLNVKQHEYYFNQAYWENKEKIQEYKKKYAKQNAEKEAQRKKKWYEANKEKALSRAKERYYRDHENELAHRKIIRKLQVQDLEKI